MRSLPYVLGVVLGLLLALVVTGCNAQSPAAPSPAPAPVLQSDGSSIPGVPLLTYHNIPATTADGVVWWVCATQPRAYCKNGVCKFEIDHYIQSLPCPDKPID
jgi:hypothetical protein